MKANVLPTIVLAGMTAASLCTASAQQTAPNPVISSPQAQPVNPPAQSTTEPSTGGKISTAVENFLGKILHRDHLTFEQLPQAVQNTVRSQAGAAPIQDVREVTSNGQTSYLVTYNRNGQNVDLQVDPDGRILGGAGPDLSSVISRPPQAIPDWRTAPVRQPLEQRAPVDLQSLPERVRDTFMTYGNGAPIDNLQRGTVAGQTIYQARVHPAAGQTMALRLDEAGTPVNDQVNDRFLAQFAQNHNGAVGRAPGSQYGTGANSANVPLSGLTPVSFNELPTAAQTTIEGQANGAPLDRISQGTLDGRTVYEVTYTHGGQPMTMRIDQDGSVLSTTATR